MVNTRIYDRAPLKDVRVKEPLVGRVRTPQILMSRHGGDYQKGDILDANTTAVLIRTMHNPDIERLQELIEEARRKLADAVMKDSVGVPGGIASLDNNGNVPVNQLGNVDVDIFMIVNELPAENIKDNKIYCVKDAESTDESNTYIEYAYINQKWEKVGLFKADPDLSNYARKDKANNFVGGLFFAFDNEFLRGIGISLANGGITYMDKGLDGDHKYLKSARRYWTTNGSSEDLNTYCVLKEDYDTDKANYAKLNTENTFTKKCLFLSAGGNVGLQVIGTTALEYLTIRSGISNSKNSKDFTYLTNGELFDITTLLSKSDYQTDKTNLTAAIDNANTAASSVNTAIEQAMRVNAELNGNVLTITDNQGTLKSVNLTDSDEHVTINMISKVDGVTLEGVVVNVYINNGSTPLSYTTPESGQIEFTVTKGATYKVVFPDVHDCASINPAQYTAAVGNRIIDAVYTKLSALPEHVKVQLVKHDLNGNQEAYPNAAVVVTIGKEDPVTYNSNDEGVVEFDVANGSTYTVECPKVNDYYIQSDKYKRSYVATQSSRIVKSNYYLYKTGLYIVTEAGNEYSLEEWQEGGYEASTAKLIKLSNEPLSMANNIIYLRISDITNRTYPTKQWCTENVLFTSITLNGNSTSDWAYYKGKESSDLILQEAEEKGRDVPAFTYAKSQSIEIGGKTVYGYIGSVGQWITLWANKDGIDDILNELYGSDVQLFSGFTSAKWTSTQSNAGGAWNFTASPSGYNKTYSCLPVPFFAY